MALFVFLWYLACGLIVSLGVVRLGRDAGSFFRFNGALALALGAIALALRILGPARWGWGAGLEPGRAATLLGGATLALVAGYLAASAFARHPAVLLRLAAVAAGLAVLADARTVHAAGGALPAGTLLHVANAGTSAWLAGSVLLAMILGHFYLVLPKLSIDPLRSLFRFSLVGLAARIVLVGAAGSLWLASEGSQALTAGAFLHSGVFVLQRVLFGLAIPASLAWFTWKTIEMRSTQSATGILYVVVFLTLVGEALSVYLSLDTTIPL